MAMRGRVKALPFRIVLPMQMQVLERQTLIWQRAQYGFLPV